MNYTLTIHPTYICNFACDFCHQNEYGDSRDYLDLDLLGQVLSTIDKPINRICLMGGEVSVLPDKYLIRLLDMVETYNVPIGTQTNLFKINPLLLKHDITVSYDFDARPQYEKVFQNMLMLEKPYDITTVISRKVFRKDINELFAFYSSLRNLRLLKLLPQKATFKGDPNSPTVEEFTSFIKTFIKLNPSFEVSQKDASFSEDKDLIIAPDGTLHTDRWHGTQIVETSVCYTCSFRDKCDIKGLISPDSEETCDYKKFLIDSINKK